MSYEQYEIFENLSELFQKLADASKEDSTGGKTITKTEIVGIMSTVLPKIGVDIID